ncbi:MAG: hypothetical protein ACRDJM_09010 [Actinomycetota bacterium]
MRRAFWALVGVGAGVAVGVAAVRAVNRTKQKYSPSNIAHQAGARGGVLAERVRLALDEGRRAMAEREAELRAELKLDQ